jgi:Flp pilus assembly protein TadG
LKTRLSIGRIKDAQGQSLVEFGIVAFLLIMMIFGVVDMCRMVLVYSTVANGARIGVRYAIVHGTNSPTTDTNVKDVVKGYLRAGTVNTANADVNVVYPDSGCTDPGCRVTVTVSYPYDLLSSYFPLSVRLGSTSQGVITF